MGEQLDKSKINILSANKVDLRKLAEFGDRSETADNRAAPLSGPTERCRMCCMLFGGMMSIATSTGVSAIQLGLAMLFEKRGHFTLSGAVRQILWIAAPSIVATTSLHYFLVENMWSGKRHTFGSAWLRASACNVALWCTAIGSGTFFWRIVLPRIPRYGKQIYHRYPISGTQLDERVLKSNKELFTGMGWSYFVCGLAHGQLGYMVVAALSVWNNRIHYFMSPHGWYAQACIPPDRRMTIERLALVRSAKK